MDMKKIPLNSYWNKIVGYALVDDDDYQKVINYSSRWHLDKFNFSTYARCKIGKKNGKRMHSVIMRPTKGMVVDHINGNGLDNRKENLRICTIGQNVTSKRHTNNKSTGYKGVYKYTDGRPKKYQAYINDKKLNKRCILGAFFSAEEAAACYNFASDLLHGKYAVLNEL